MERLEAKEPEPTVSATSLEVFKWRLEVTHEGGTVLDHWMALADPFQI